MRSFAPLLVVLVQVAEPDAPRLGLLEAVLLALERDPNIAVAQARFDSSRGAATAAAGQFDPALSSSLTGDDSETPTSESAASSSRSLTQSVGLTRQLRSGQTVSPSVELVRSEDPTAPAEADNEATVSFEIRQPLLRGRGRAVTTAVETAAQREAAAAALDLRHTVSQRVAAVASQYWLVKAAELDLAVLRASETSAAELLATTRRLIAADQVPAAEEVQLEANLAAKQSAVIAGERSLFAARQALGREIGLDAAEIAALALPGEAFPETEPDEVPRDPLVALAVELRADLQAAREREDAAQALLAAAENALSPQLDLVLTPSYSGFVSGDDGTSFFSPLYRNVPGLSSTLSLSFLFPLGNHRAEGQLLQSQAGRRQAGLFTELIVKGIGADVPAAAQAVESTALRLAKAREAVHLFERTVVNEEKKLRAGSSTLIDLISQRDRLTAALQTEVAAQLDLALALLDLRFQTGSLLAGDAGSGAVDLARLTTLP
jgi:outer membrane protein TolC